MIFSPAADSSLWAPYCLANWIESEEENYER
jgi:hypothetical protein